MRRFAAYQEAAHRRPPLAAALSELLAPERVLSNPVELVAYEYDGSLNRGRPDVVVFPETAEEVSAVYALARREGVAVIPRGSGTNLSGGSVAPTGGIVLEMARFRQILEVDAASRRAVAEPGVYNFDLNEEVARYNLFFAPDPSSWKVATLGGNGAENSGGPRAFKYGVTSPHITGITLVTPTGDILRLGGKTLHGAGYDLVGLVVGSEGTLGTVTELTLRLLRQPEAVETLMAAFGSIEDAGAAVSAVVAAGIIPAALEIMDRTVVRAVEATLHCGYPTDAAAVLIVDLDGLREQIAVDRGRVRELFQRHGATEIREASDEAAREQLWRGRRGAFAALADLADMQIVCDGTVPRDRLPEVCRQVEALCERFGVLMANGFHAGDGNLHPKLLIDGRTPGAQRTIEEVSMAILDICIQAGGTITGEHGVGLEKVGALGLVIDPPTLEVMRRIRWLFDPAGIANPHKIFSPKPTPPPLAPLAVDDVVEALRDAIGPDNVVTDLGRLQACEVDGLVPRAIARPADEQGIAAALAACTAARAAVLPWGAGSQREAGPPLERLDVILDLSRLSQLTEHRPSNVTATLQAGMSLSLARNLVLRECQLLPSDAADELTVGGLLATRAGGSHRLSLGPIRDHVLGMTVVLATGEIIHCGGRVVKNVAGYDLGKLFIGSRGTLGVITEATLKLVPQPEGRGAVRGWFDEVPAAFAAADALLNSPLEPQMVDLDLPCGEATSGTSLVARFSGSARALERQLRDASRLVADHGASRVLPGHVGDSVSPGTAWAEFELLVPAGQSEWAARTVVEALVKRELTASCRCSVGIGAIRLAIRDPMGDYALLDDLAAVVAELGGHIIAHRGPTDLRRALYERQDEPGGFDWMCRIKQELDPHGILAPGKLLGRM